MNLNRLKVAVVGASLLCGLQLNAQKSNVVSAAVEYKKYAPAFYSQKFDEAKEVLLECKSYIDPAMEHESTKDDEKAHYYNGIIYFGLVELSGMPGNEDLAEFQSEETMEMIENSLKIAHDHRKFKRDVEDFVNQKSSQLSMFGKSSFDNEDYKMAYAGFSGAYEVQKIIDIEDEDMKTNALISANNAIQNMKANGELDEALEFIEDTKDVFPNNTELAIEGVNIALEQGDMDKAETFFNAAAEADPENVALFTSMGSIFLSSGDKLSAELAQMDVTDENYGETVEKVDELFKKAEKNLKRALEIEPKNMDAAYNLGVLYLGKGEKLTMKANSMAFDDPNYDSTIEQSEEMYKKAITPLEVYIEQDPENAGVLQVLFQVHRKAGNTEEALEYKRRAEEAAAE